MMPDVAALSALAELCRRCLKNCDQFPISGIVISEPRTGLHKHQFVFRIDHYELAAKTLKREHAVISGDKPHLVAVSGPIRIGETQMGIGRCDGGPREQSFFGDNGFIVPFTVMSKHQAEARPIPKRRVEVGIRNLAARRVQRPLGVGLCAQGHPQLLPCVVG